MSTCSPVQTQTIKNLQTAFEGETNAAAKYTAFAIRAKDEGYLRVAALFRATARAELQHASSHARVLRLRWTEPVATVHEFKVGTTADNLKAALEGEQYERDTMYPGFVKEAELAGEKAALNSFRFAMKAEAEHAKLYAACLANLEAQREPTTFYVCTVCGEVTDDPNHGNCSICNAPAEKFEAVTA